MIKREDTPMNCQNGTAAKKQKFDEEFRNDVSPIKQVLRHDYDCFFDDTADLELMAIAEETNMVATRPQFDLGQWQRCLVKEVKRECDLILLVQSDVQDDKENEAALVTCHLQGPWKHAHVEVGDLVSLLAVWDDKLNAYKVEKDNGFCVTNPDTLISGTTVVGSLFCRRKAVLQDHFRGIDANNKGMVIGSLVHELLQKVLAKGLETYEEISAITQTLLESQETAYELYGNIMTHEETVLEVQKFVPNIVAFVEQYVLGQDPPMLQKDLFQGCITEIQDIEENLWVPQLGLKGKIDVSVNVRRRCNETNSANKNAIPLELKTGRASFSMEHKGQLILYQMMLTATTRNVNSGLLLYLREGIMREVQGRRNEQRDLVMLRNDLAHYLSHLPALPAAGLSLSRGEGKFVQPLALPEPISHHSACSSCAYATICCSFAQTDEEMHLREGHPLHKVMQDMTAHLKPQDYDYFISWCALLSLEEQEARKMNYMRALWTDAPEARQRNGRAIVDLVLRDDVLFKEARYVHTFELNHEIRGTQSNQDKMQEHNQKIDLTISGLSLGEYVIVSTGKRLAIAAGCICELTKDTISISLERNLQQNYARQCFIIDKHESQSGNVFNFTNLGQLLENTPRAAALRAIVVQRQQPSYSKVLPKLVATEGAEILQQLNAGQRSAILKALTTENYMLIKGLPGTGKTQTLVSIVRILQLMGKSVLITSHTHSAVDNLLLRLHEYGLPILRLGSAARVHDQLHACSESELTKQAHTEQELARIYGSFNIVGVTCLGASHSIFLHRHFDYCIVDEATQVIQSTVLRPLFFCDKFILVGDPEQLPPLIRSKEARLRGADESLFHRLDTLEATAVLTLQYRMNKTITKLANNLTYAGALQCASQEVQLAAIKLQLPPTDKWLQRVLQTHVDQSVVLLDTQNCAERSYDFALSKHSNTFTAIAQSYSETGCEPVHATPDCQQKTKRNRYCQYTNYCDAAVIFQLVETLLVAGYAADRIGIITPYRAQVELLRKLAAQHHAYHKLRIPTLNFDTIEVNTVDQYQGRDKDIILYSCTRTGDPKSRDLERVRDAEILEDKRRLTVAITRSKLKLILIGDAACLQQYTPFRSLLTHIPSYSKLQLQDGKLDFQWQPLLAKLSEIIGSN